MAKNRQTTILLCLLTIVILASCATNLLTGKGKLEPEVSKLIQAVPTPESYPDADIIYILDEGIEEFFSDGRSNCTVHMVFKIVSERGKGYANHKIGYNSRTETVNLLYARTITPEGKIIPLKKNAIKTVTPYSRYPSYSDYKKLTFSMPGVSIGCVIDYKYQIEKKPTIEGKFTGHYFFQVGEPVLFSRYKVITPEDIDLKYRLLNPLKDIQRSLVVANQGGKKSYLWEYRDIPQILYEKRMPPMDEIAFKILVTTTDSWEEFFSWWRKEIEGKTKPDKIIKEKVAELTKDFSTAGEKIEALFDYVKREIQYVFINLGKSGYEPTSAQEVFENKYGDCKDQSTLLISMLRAAGIQAYYVLVPTNNVGNLIKDFPYPFQFNHCIVAAEKEGGYQFLDPIAEYRRFDDLPVSDQDRGILIFKDHGTIFGKTPLAESKNNARFRQQHIDIKADGAIVGEIKDTCSGFKEASRRSLYTDSSPTEIREGLEGIVDGISHGAKLLDYTYTDPLDFKKRFTYSIKYNAPDYCKKAGDILIFQLLGIEASCAATDKEARRYPIEHHSNCYVKNEVNFNIPEGYELYYLPEPVEIKNPYFEYHSSYQKKGRKIFYQGEFIGNAVQTPPEEYADYRKSCHEMEKSYERYVLFRERK